MSNNGNGKGSDENYNEVVQQGKNWVNNKGTKHNDDNEVDDDGYKGNKSSKGDEGNKGMS